MSEGADVNHEQRAGCKTRQGWQPVANFVIDRRVGDGCACPPGAQPLVFQFQFNNGFRTTVVASDSQLPASD
eukprot:364773-Chlamydomonas_euryale.AAC.3